MSETVSSIEEQLRLHGRLVYKNIGDSMKPLIRSGKDLVVIVPKGEERLKKYDIPLYRRKGQGPYVLHRILKVRGDDYVLCGDNRWHRETGISDEDIVGVLSEVVRNGVSLSLHDWRYRLYVHVWCDLFPLRAAILWLRCLPGRVWKKMRRSHEG